MLHKIQKQIEDLVEQYRWWLVAVCLLSVVVIFLGTKLLTNNSGDLTPNENHSLVQSDKKRDVSKESSTYVTEDQNKTSDNQWWVDVKGAVKRPGIYAVHQNQRITDAIKLAGGVTKDADLQQCNQAIKLQDEMIVHIPVKGEQKDSEAISSNEEANQKINLNKASEQELTTLPGVGLKRAQDIIVFREQNAFKQIDDLGKVPGIGPKMLAKLNNLVTI